MIVRADIYDALYVATSYWSQPPELIAGIIQVESAWNPNAVGDNGRSYGLMQLNLDGAGAGYPIEELLNIGTNLHIGTGYLRDLLDALNLDPVWAISAYNQGLQGVLDRGPDYNWGYVQAVLDAWERFRREGLQREGDPPSPEPGPPEPGPPQYTADIAEIRRQLALAGWGGGNDHEAMEAFLRTVQPGTQLELVNRIRSYLGLAPYPEPVPPEIPPSPPPPAPSPIPYLGLKSSLYWIADGLGQIGTTFDDLGRATQQVPLLGGVLSWPFYTLGGWWHAHGQMFRLVGDGLGWIEDRVREGVNPGAILVSLASLVPELRWSIWDHLDNLVPKLNLYWWGWGQTSVDFVWSIWHSLVERFPILNFNAWDLTVWAQDAMQWRFPILSFEPMAFLELTRSWIEYWWPQLNLDPWGLVNWLQDALRTFFPLLDTTSETGKNTWDTWLREWFDYWVENAAEWLQARATRVLEKVW